MKRLYKSRKNRVIDGVCGGIAEYLNVDPAVIRIVFVLMFFFGGGGVLAYILGMLIIPREPWPEPAQAGAPAAGTQAAAPATAQAGTTPAQPGAAAAPAAGGLIIGALLILFGGLFLLRNFHFFNPYYWWMRHYVWGNFWPLLLVVIGLVLIFRPGRQS